MSDIKHCFRSRFVNGSLMQFDYSQLEVRVLAFLSGDEVLKRDLADGVDLHCMAGQFLSAIPYEELRRKYLAGDAAATSIRKQAKACAFLTQYGGGAGALASGTGLNIERCRHFLKQYYLRYSGVKLWQDKVMELVKKHSTPSKIIIKGQQARMSRINSRTSRRYTFYEQEAPAFLKSRGVNLSFSPTQAKNYPVQGLATGDIVPMMLGRLNRFLWEHYPQVVLVNTIHDSVILDIPRDVRQLQIASDVRALLESAPAVLHQVFGVRFDVALPVDIEVGKDWGNLVTLTMLR